MTGRVLSEEEIRHFEDHASDFLAEGVDNSLFRETLKGVLDLIATIRDLQRQMDNYKQIAMNHEKAEQSAYETIRKLDRENAILREALQQICKCDALKVIVWAEVNERDISERDYLINIAREALAKVRGDD